MGHTMGRRHAELVGAAGGEIEGCGLDSIFSRAVAVTR